VHSEVTLQIAADHPALAGHFPGRPIVPGVVLLDAAVHALGELLGASTSGAIEVRSAKFLSPVAPGETVMISLDATAARVARFEMSSDGRKVATGTLVLAPPS
jgi:3-hydroxyacyl-[acyl-carrier-protein] dehydratase